MDDEVEQVSMDATLVRRIRDRVQSSEFDSVQEYIEFTMASLLEELEASEGQTNEEDDVAVRDRLESLGYVDE